MNKKDLKPMYEVGEIYEFDYESQTEKREDGKTKALVRLSDDEIFSLQAELRQFKKEHAKRLLEQYELAKAVHTAKSSDLVEKLKAEYNEKFRGHSADAPLNVKARNLFYRNYKEENMRSGNSIQAVYGGRTITVNGIISDRWYCVSPSRITVDKITNGDYDLSNFLVEIIEE